MEKIQKYEGNYKETKLWQKLLNNAVDLSKSLIVKVLSLYYSAKDERTPKWAKSTMFGALGYFIFPLDAIPDFIPVAGYTDDMAMITAAIATVALYIRDEHKDKAKEKFKEMLRVVEN